MKSTLKVKTNDPNKSGFSIIGKLVYGAALALVVPIVLALPFIVAADGQGTDFLRSLFYKNIITAPLSGRVKALYIKEIFFTNDHQPYTALRPSILEGQTCTHQACTVTAPANQREYQESKTSAITKPGSFSTKVSVWCGKLIARIGKAFSDGLAVIWNNVKPLPREEKN